MPDLGLEPQQCLHLSKNVEKNGSATKRLAGVALQVNLRDALHTANKECNQGIHPGFETQDRRHQQSKTSVSVAPHCRIFWVGSGPSGKSWIRHYIRNKNSVFKINFNLTKQVRIQEFAWERGQVILKSFIYLVFKGSIFHHHRCGINVSYSQLLLLRRIFSSIQIH